MRSETAYPRVRKEIIHLRKSLDKKVLDKLNIDEFDGGQAECCVYGLMFVSAYSTAAKKAKGKFMRRISDVHTPLEKYLLWKTKLHPSVKMIFKYLKGDIKRLRTLQ
jgi:hypothetical protein